MGEDESELIRRRGRDWEKLSPAEIAEADRLEQELARHSFEGTNAALRNAILISLKAAGCLVTFGVALFCLYALVRFIKWAWYS